jgi:hypothetical protein
MMIGLQVNHNVRIKNFMRRFTMNYLLGRIKDIDNEDFNGDVSERRRCFTNFHFEFSSRLSKRIKIQFEFFIKFPRIVSLDPLPESFFLS